MSLTICLDCGREASSTAAGEAAPPVSPEARERVVYKKRRVSFRNVILGSTW